MKSRIDFFISGYDYIIKLVILFCKINRLFCAESDKRVRIGAFAAYYRHRKNVGFGRSARVRVDDMVAKNTAFRGIISLVNAGSRDKPIFDFYAAEACAEFAQRVGYLQIPAVLRVFAEIKTA